MKKRLLAMLTVVLLISITAVSVFAYTPNKTPYIYRSYPDEVAYYGGLPNSSSNMQISGLNFFGNTWECPKCGEPIIALYGAVIEDMFGYYDGDYWIIDGQEISGTWLFGSYDNLNRPAFGGRPNTDMYLTNSISWDRNYQCVVELDRDINAYFDLAQIPDGESGVVNVAYKHVSPMESSYVSDVRALHFKNTSSEISTGISDTLYSDLTSLGSDSYNYYGYINRIFAINGLEDFYPTSGSGSDDGSYDEGYSVGYEEGKTVGKQEGIEEGKTEGYQNGFSEGRIQGQAEGEFFDNGMDNLFERLFNSFEGFISPFLSLGWGALTVGSLLGMLLVVGITLLIVKIIRG